MILTMGVQSQVAYSGAVIDSMTFGLNGSSEYVVKDIDGLGPVKANFSNSDNPSDPGVTFLSARDEQRNVVITMGFNPLYSSGSNMEALRRDLKRVFMPTTMVKITFTDSVLGQYYLIGRVESHDPKIFSEDPEVVISILCSDPYFYSTGPDVVFEIPTLVNTFLDFDLPYLNDVPTGFLWEFTTKNTAIVDYDNVALILDRTYGFYQEAPPLFTRQLSIKYAYLNNDIIRVDTRRGQRGAQRTRGITTVNLMAAFSGSLTAVKLMPGVNSFTLNQVVPVGNAQLINAKITYPRMTGGL